MGLHFNRNDANLRGMEKIFIKAINPGYKIDGVNNVGEMIEIGWLKSDEDDGTMVSLAGLTVGYTNSSGNYTALVEFPENSYLAGESILLRLASSPGHELAAINYTKTLAFKAGPLVLKLGDDIIDEVCWTGKDDCPEPFDGTNPTTLVRNLETGEFEHIKGYEPEYVAENYFVEKEEGFGAAASQCAGLQFSEILSYYVDSKDEQFIEFFNPGAEQVLLDGCKIRYKNKTYPLVGVMKPEEYFVRYLSDFNITKNPNSANVLELLDVDDTVVDKLEYPNGQRKGTSYMFVGYDVDGQEIWKVTYAPTPGEPNNYQEFKTCEVGKVLNPITGNCVKITTVKEKTCAAGQVLNPLTGRCNKIPETTVKTCKDGYALDPETGRCKKIKENTGANYGLAVENYQENSTFVAVFIVVAIVLVGLGYVVYEFRHEIGKLCGKVFRRFQRKPPRGTGRR